MTKRSSGSIALAVAGIMVFGTASSLLAAERCQILDNLYEPIYRISAGLIPRSSLGSGHVTIFELDADWELGYLRNIFGGEMDLHLRSRNNFLFGRGDVDIPETLHSLALDIGWTLRLAQGKAVQVRALPGLYGDTGSFNSRGFYIPFSLAMIQAFHRDLSGIVGLDIRPGFDQIVMPLIGIKWEPIHALGLELGLPKSRLTWFMGPDWVSYAGFEWRNRSYAVSDSRRMATLQDYRVFGGLAHRLSDQMEIFFEAGNSYDRDAKLKQGGRHTIAPATVGRIGIGGPF